jgi:DNA-binding CsgD family transcriptional regulator
MRPFGSNTAAAENLVGELRAVARVREQHSAALWDAIAELTLVTLNDSLAAVADALPLVVDADCATIRLKDEQGRLHLVAASGCSASDTRMRALQPVDARVAVRLADPAALERHARSQGFRWVRIEWLGRGDAPLGSLLLGSRTERRPHPFQLETLIEIAARLGAALAAVPGIASRAKSCALELARSIEPVRADHEPDDVANLRPRERGILELYADGLSTRQIAGLLVISEHTVRTHVKTALRTLGVHTRADAARMVRASQLSLF